MMQWWASIRATTWTDCRRGKPWRFVERVTSKHPGRFRNGPCRRRNSIPGTTASRRPSSCSLTGHGMGGGDGVIRKCHRRRNSACPLRHPRMRCASRRGTPHRGGFVPSDAPASSRRGLRGLRAIRNRPRAGAAGQLGREHTPGQEPRRRRRPFPTAESCPLPTLSAAGKTAVLDDDDGVNGYISDVRTYV